MTTPRLRLRRRSAVPARLLFGLAAGLCACGPSVPLDAGLRQQAVDIGFGRQHPPTPKPTPPQALPVFANLGPNFPAPLVVPPLTLPGLVIPPQAAPACPTAPPTAFPELPADLAATQPPSGATYPFRYTGSQVFNPGASQARTVRLPAVGTRQVANVSPPAADGSYTFDVVEAYNGKTVTTTYHVVPSGASGPQPPNVPQQTLVASPSPSLPPPQNNSVQAGLFLQRMTEPNPNGGNDVFAPTPEVLLMPFPAQQSLTYQGGGVDGSNGAAMETDPEGGVIHDRARVDACGTVLDSWQAEIKGHLLDARNSGATQPKTFDLTIDVGTQFGGIVLGYHLLEHGADDQSGQPFDYDLASTIDVAPQPPQGTQ